MAFAKLIYDALQKSANTGGMDAKTAAIVKTIPPPPKTEGMGGITGAVFTIVAATILTPFVGVPLAAAMSSAGVTAANGGDVKQIATNAVLSYVTVSPNLSVTQKIAASSAVQLANGAKPEDVIRNAVGTVAAYQVPEVLKNINKEIASFAPNTVQDTVKSAMVNAENQAVFALITKQDVAANAIAGAVGGTVADVSKFGFDDPIAQKAIGEYAKYVSLGVPSQNAAAFAASDYAIDLAIAESKKPTGGMLPTSAKVGSRIGSLSASTGDIDLTVPSEIAANEKFKTMPGEVGENIIKYTDKDGIVTYQKRVTSQTPIGNKIGYTIVYDPELNEFQYEYYTKTAQGTETISSKTKPSLTTPDAPQIILPPRLAGAQTGQRIQGEDFGVSTVRQKAAPSTNGDSLQVDVSGGVSVEQMPTLSLLRRVRTGQETRQNEAPLQVDVYGGTEADVPQRERSLPPTETVAQRDMPETQRLIQPSETESSRRVNEEEEPVAQREPSSSIILDLISGGGRQVTRQQRTPNEREAASMQALSQAVSVGDPGDALFGSGLGRRRNVWNVESLRLKDELGG
jgi:hypothetical protein